MYELKCDHCGEEVSGAVKESVEAAMDRHLCGKHPKPAKPTKAAKHDDKD